MNYQIYYRKSLMDKEELQAASQYFDCVDLLTDIKENTQVIARYSLYPFFKDQEREILNLNSKLINSYEEHLYIADLQNYVGDLKELTPKTWFRLEDIPDNMSFVLKGETNSKKNDWLKSMFAKDKQAAGEVYSRLCQDGLIGDQKIYIREYIPLVKYLDGINGMPVTKEFRFFIAYDQIVSGAFYWQNYLYDLDYIPDEEEVPKILLQEVIKRVNKKSNFYTIDVGQKTDGSWIVIELNDGCQAGLSCNDPFIFYKNLRNILNAK